MCIDYYLGSIVHSIVIKYTFQNEEFHRSSTMLLDIAYLQYSNYHNISCNFKIVYICSRRERRNCLSDGYLIIQKVSCGTTKYIIYDIIVKQTVCTDIAHRVSYDITVQLMENNLHYS